MATETFQPSTKDAYLRGGHATNYGTSERLIIADYSVPNRAILTFDVSSFSGSFSGKTAKLYLYYYDKQSGDWAPSGAQVDVYKVRRTDWSETTSSWDVYKKVDIKYYYWSGVGASDTTSDIDTSLSGSFTMPSSYGWIECDITDIVEDAIDNKSGIVDILVRYNVEGQSIYGGVHFYSREGSSGDTTRRPKIVIESTADSFKSTITII